MRQHRDHARQTAREEHPDEAMKHRGVLPKVGRAQVLKNAVQRKGDSEEAILTVQRWIGERLRRELCSQRNVGAYPENEMDRSDNQEDGSR